VTIAEKEEILEQAARECASADKTTQFHVKMDLPSAILLVGMVQLAMRHPENDGMARYVGLGLVANMIVKMREFGFLACAELAELGDDPRYDP
jgi:hypothetical protein